jgi:hypothetical protein
MDEGKGAPRVFCVSVHSKENKEVYFYRFTEVFILKGLTGSFCTKIVQVSEVLHSKGLGVLRRNQRAKMEAGNW